MANYEAHPRTRTVGPRTQHEPDRKELATSHLKVCLSISVTKASMYLCRDRRRCADQSGGIYNSDSTVARHLVNRPKSEGEARGQGRFTLP